MVFTDALAYLKRTNKKFDIIFVGEKLNNLYEMFAYEDAKHFIDIIHERISEGRLTIDNSASKMENSTSKKLLSINVQNLSPR